MNKLPNIDFILNVWLPSCVENNPHTVIEFLKLNFSEDIIEQMKVVACKKNYGCIYYIDNPPKEAIFAILEQSRTVIFSINPKFITEDIILKAMEIEWNVEFYERLIDEFNPDSERFHKEINKLKVKHGPMSE